MAELSTAAELYRGEFLVGLNIAEEQFSEWKGRERFRGQKSYVRVLTKLLDIHQGSGVASFDTVEEIANKLLALNAADEDAHRALMSLYAKQGKHLIALEQFSTCRQQLRAIGAVPSEDTMALLEAIRSGELAPTRTRRNTDSTLDVIESGDVIQRRWGPFGTLVAVAPFTVVAGNDEDASYAQLIAEEVLRAVTRFKWIRVVPSSESLRVQDPMLTPLALGQMTGAKYVVDGRLRRVGTELTVSVELVDCDSLSTVWASDRIGVGLSNSEMAVAGKVASRLEENLRTSEINRVRKDPEAMHSPYDCMLLAVSNMYDLSRSNFDAAERLFEMATHGGTAHSSVYAYWALWRMWCLGQGWANDQGDALTYLSTLSKEALNRDPSDALALAISAHFEVFWRKDFDRAQALFDTSLSENPHSVLGWTLSATTDAYSGATMDALEKLAVADSLGNIGPHLRFIYTSARCIAALFARDYEAAKRWGAETVQSNPHFVNGYKQLLVALGHTGSAQEAHEYTRKLLELEPDFSVRTFLDMYPFRREADAQSFADGLINVGLPFDRQQLDDVVARASGKQGL